jgi:hypothetical protein
MDDISIYRVTFSSRPCDPDPTDMDPHSRLSQFNQRPPKAGPAVSNQRQMDSSPHSKSPSLDRFAKRSPRTRQSRGPCKKSTSSLPSRSPTPLLDGDPSRPIVTNARIKRGERLRKDMYLAFVKNALEQKTLVRPFRLPRSLFYLFMPEPLPSHAGK